MTSLIIKYPRCYLKSKRPKNPHVKHCDSDLFPLVRPVECQFLHGKKVHAVIYVSIPSSSFFLGEKILFDNCNQDLEKLWRGRREGGGGGDTVLCAGSQICRSDDE